MLFPTTCAGCGALGGELCSNCFLQLKQIPRFTCPYCFNFSPGGLTHTHCKTPFCLDGAQSLIQYNKIAKKIIQRTKYSLAYQTLSVVLSQIPPTWYRSIIDFTLRLNPQPHLLAIPLHPKRLAKRGFNQADIVANHLAHLTKLKATHLLVRDKNTSPQALVPSKQARRENIQNAFLFINTNGTIPQTIILIDDVYTSGATAKEAARVLKMNGVQQVFLYTFSHGL